MENVFLARFFLFLLFKCCQFGVLGPILPIVDNVFGGYNDVGLVHSHKAGLDSDGLSLNGATDGVAEDKVPLSGLVLYSGDQDTVLTTGNYLLKTTHILDVLLVDAYVPEHNAHVVALWLLKGKDQCVVKVGPLVLGLDVGKQDVRIYCQTNAKTVTFPRERAYNA